MIDDRILSALTGVTADSRAVQDGYLFAALTGSKEDGSQFIADAVRHGAAVVLAKTGTTLPAGGEHVVLITDDNPRRAFAHVCARYYNIQPEHIVAVTGTSGKTSTVSFTQQLWHLSGIQKCASLGTLGIRGPGLIRSGSLTTPPSDKLMAELADLAAAGITHLAIEASSHGLDQYRLDGVKIARAAYTNLSRDHLDYHADMDEYFTAKSRLFTELLSPDGTAVIMMDDDYAPKLLEICARRKLNIITAGKNAKDIVLKNRTPLPGGQKIDLDVFGVPYQMTLPLVGEFQILNALTALALAIPDQKSAQDFVPLLEKLHGVPGRLELVSGHPKGAAVYVDYAHKPAALEAILKTLRPHTERKLVCLVGCGGDRDPGKRPMMGRIAATLSDLAIITDDNPRTEDAGKIRDQMMAGANPVGGAKNISDRRAAIEWAVTQLQAGDVLVVAGKGHESGQIIGETAYPFDDVDEVKKAMERAPA